MRCYAAAYLTSLCIITLLVLYDSQVADVDPAYQACFQQLTPQFFLSFLAHGLNVNGFELSLTLNITFWHTMVCH